MPRQDGKGSILEARELAGLFLLDEVLQTHTAHEFKTAQEHFQRLATLVDGLPARYKRRVKQIREAHGSESIELRNPRQRIRFLARSGGSGRGFSGDLVVLDEAMILWAQAMGALLPTMAARANVTVGGPQLWYAGSAGLDDERSEVFARVRDRGIAGAERLFYAEWSAGEPDDHTGANVDLDNVSEWYRANPAMHGSKPRMELEFVENERAELDDDRFARERLCLWTGGGLNSPIDPDKWRAMADPKMSLPTRALAVDVPPEGKRATIARAGIRPDGKPGVEVDSRPGTTWAAERLAELSKKRNAPVIIDGGSRAAALIPKLVELGVTPVVYATRQITRACSGFLDRVDEDGLRHMGQAELNMAVDAARRRKVGDAWAWHRRDTSADITPLVAATLAVEGLNEPPPRRKTGRAMAV